MASDNTLNDKSFEIASDSQYDGYKKGLTSMVYNSFIKTILVEKERKTMLLQITNYLMNYTNQLSKNTIMNINLL